MGNAGKKTISLPAELAREAEEAEKSEAFLEEGQLNMEPDSLPPWALPDEDEKESGIEEDTQ